MVGILNSIIHWRFYFKKILPNNVNGVVLVLHHECVAARDATKGENRTPLQLDAFTFVINGEKAEVIGFGDHHDPDFDSWERRVDFIDTHIMDGTMSGLDMDTTCNCKSASGGRNQKNNRCLSPMICCSTSVVRPHSHLLFKAIPWYLSN